METDDQETLKPKSSCLELMLITLLVLPIAFASLNFLSRSVVDSFPLLPDVAVVSTSAASISRLSATAASAEGVLVAVLMRNNNTRPLYFTNVSIVSHGGTAQTSPFVVERSRSSVVWFRLEKATALMGPTGVPRFRVGLEARVRFGSQEISMVSKCFSDEIGFNLNINSNLTNYSSDYMNIDDDNDVAEIFKSGGCESEGFWSKNIVKMRAALYLGILVLVAFILLLLSISTWVMAKLSQYWKTSSTHAEHNYQNLAEALIYSSV